MCLREMQVLLYHDNESPGASVTGAIKHWPFIHSRANMLALKTSNSSLQRVARQCVARQCANDYWFKLCSKIATNNNKAMYDGFKQPLVKESASSEEG